jgi:hypothetical protein
VIRATYKFRAVGPGLDFAEWVEADGLDEVLEHLILAGQKFKRDAAKIVLIEENPDTFVKPSPVPEDNYPIG